MLLSSSDKHLCQFIVFCTNSQLFKYFINTELHKTHTCNKKTITLYINNDNSSCYVATSFLNIITSTHSNYSVNTQDYWYILYCCICDQQEGQTNYTSPNWITYQCIQQIDWIWGHRTPIAHLTLSTWASDTFLLCRQYDHYLHRVGSKHRQGHQ